MSIPALLHVAARYGVQQGDNGSVQQARLVDCACDMRRVRRMEKSLEWDGCRCCDESGMALTCHLRVYEGGG
jgi:hypothetical protein